MGLLNAKNINKAKTLLDKNRDKVAGVAAKATAAADKASKGKTAGISAKVNDAAKKYSGADEAKDI